MTPQGWTRTMIATGSDRRWSGQSSPTMVRSSLGERVGKSHRARAVVD